MNNFTTHNCPDDKISEINRLNFKYHIDNNFIVLDHTKNLEQQFKIAIEHIDYWNYGGLALWKLKREKKDISDQCRNAIINIGTCLLNQKKGPVYAVIIDVIKNQKNFGFLVHGNDPSNPTITSIKW